MGCEGWQISVREGIKLFRDETSVTPEELGRIGGVSKRTAENWCHGRRPSDGAMFRLATYLNAFRSVNHK